MSFPRYPEYKDSGVKWLGEVPKHWEVRPIKAMAMLKGGAGFPDAEQGVEKEELYFYKVAALGQADAKGVLQAPPDSVSRDTAKRLGAFVFPAGSLTFAKVGAALLLARIRQLPAPSCLDNNMMGMLVNQVNDTRFVLFAMSLVRFDLIANPGAVPSLNASQIGNFQLALPPLAEQAAIATFLDRETAKIDALVAEQEKLIALLQEKRQAVISHAVTKGLDPNVPMKDSGVEWLGEVPGHWEAITLRRCALAVQTGGTPSPDALSESLDEGFVWYTPGDFSSSLKLSTSTRRIANESVASGEAKVFPPKSVLIVSIGATLGKVGFAQDTSSANQQINAVIPGARVDGYFLAWSLSVKSEAMRFLSNASTIGIMNQEKTKEIWIALPPREEQTAIATFLDQETTNIDTLVTEARTAITLLQERRTALISAAVTGQIDVRGLTGGANTPVLVAASAYAVSA